MEIKKKMIGGNVCPNCGLHLQDVRVESRKNKPLSEGWKHMISLGEWCMNCEILWQ